MILTFIQLEYFETVCLYESINKAAEQLHVSQPAITKAIQQLESEFDVALFHRLGNHLSLTEEGEFFLRYSKDITNRIRLLEERMHEKAHSKQTIKLGAPPMIGAFMFPHLFKQFKDAHPGINIEIFEHGSSQMAQLIDDDTLDMAIIILNDLPLSQYNMVHIYDTELLYCTNAASAFVRLDRISLSDIQDSPLILMKEGSYQNPVIKARFAEQQLVPNVILYSNQVHTIKNFIKHDFASAFILKEVLDAQDDLVTIPLSEPMPIQIGLIWKKKIHLPSHALTFIKFIQKYEFK